MASKNKTTPVPVETPLVEDVEIDQVITVSEPRVKISEGLVERRMNTLQKRATGVLNHDSSDPEDQGGDEGGECGVTPPLIDLDNEMDQAGNSPTLPSPPGSLSLGVDSLSESDQDLETVSPCERVQEPSKLEVLHYQPDPEVMRALDEMAAPAAEMEDMVDTSEWNYKSEGRSVTETEHGTVAQNVAIKMPELRETGGPCEVKSSKRVWLFSEKNARALFRDCVGEAVGTFFLILVCVGSANSRALVGLTPGEPGAVQYAPLYFLTISCAFGFGIGGIVHLLSATSGGHVNPAVTWALFLDRRISVVRFVLYILAQFIGGFAGAGALYGLGSHKELHEDIKGGNSYDSTYISHGDAFVLEGLGTMFLVLTILCSIDEQRGHAASHLQPLAIGIAILVIHIWLIPYTNCGINPVRGVVWNIVIGQATYQTLVFLFAPFVGSGFALAIFHLVLKPCPC
ncbi:uncharacterized protein LOC134818641 [Bolinopsis microptera]|uniref:uncharacterized protein LOC134818641 n=1 Tax=Bolinopsis microptera TaxID=2820187 RepID=UPI003079576C